MELGTMGSLYIYGLEDHLSGNDMVVTVLTRDPVNGRKAFQCYETMIRETPTLQSKWVLDSSTGKYRWDRFSSEELEKLLMVEKKELSRSMKIDDVFQEYFPTNSCLPLRINIVNSTTLVFSTNHTFTNGLGVLAWIDKWLGYYFGRVADDGDIIAIVEKQLSVTKSRSMRIVSSLRALSYMTGFFFKSGKNAGSETIDLSRGKNPVTGKQRYSVLVFHFTKEETNIIIQGSKKSGLTVSELLCTILVHCFFERYRGNENRRICVSAPVDVRQEFKGITPFSPGNFTASHIFQIWNDAPIKRQVKKAFNGFKKNIPIGISQIVRLFMRDQQSLLKHLSEQARKPIPERAPLENYTLALSNMGNIIFPHLLKYACAISGHTKTQTIFVAPVTLNGELRIEVCFSQDLYEKKEIESLFNRADEIIRSGSYHID